MKEKTENEVGKYKQREVQCESIYAFAKAYNYKMVYSENGRILNMLKGWGKRDYCMN